MTRVSQIPNPTIRLYPTFNMFPTFRLNSPCTGNLCVWAPASVGPFGPEGVWSNFEGEGGGSQKFILGKTPQFMNHFSSVVRIRTKSEITVILSAPTTTNSQPVLIKDDKRRLLYTLDQAWFVRLSWFEYTYQDLQTLSYVELASSSIYWLVHLLPKTLQGALTK